MYYPWEKNVGEMNPSWAVLLDSAWVSWLLQFLELYVNSGVAERLLVDKIHTTTTLKVVDPSSDSPFFSYLSFISCYKRQQIFWQLAHINQLS